MAMETAARLSGVCFSTTILDLCALVKSRLLLLYGEDKSSAVHWMPGLTSKTANTF